MSNLRLKDYVKISQKDCENSFAYWPSTRIFRVTSMNDEYVWVNHLSMGLPPSKIVPASPEEIKNHKKLYNADGTSKLQTCKCGKHFDKKEIARTHGKESSVYLFNYCSAFCYTKHTVNQVKIKSSKDCSNKNCEGGVITFDGQSGKICKKCNPESSDKVATLNGNDLEGRGALLGLALTYSAKSNGYTHFKMDREFVNALIEEYNISMNTIIELSKTKK